MAALRLVLSTSVLALAASSFAEACTSTNCILATSGSDTATLRKGRWRLDLTLRGIDQDRPLYGDEPLRVSGAPYPEVLRPRVNFRTGRLEPNYHHEYAATGRFVQADVSHGLTSRLTIVASLPVYGRRTVEHLYYPALAGANHRHLSDTIARRPFSTAGFGDAQLSLRYRLRSWLQLGTGLQLPTGRSGLPDEYGEVADPMHQPGAGASGVILSLGTLGRVASLGADWSAAASYQTNRESSRRYRLGSDAIVTAGMSRKIWAPVSGLLQMKLQQTSRSEFAGQPIPSTGATILTVAPGVRLRVPGGAALAVSVQLPLYQHVNESQLAYRSVASVGLSVAR